MKGEQTLRRQEATTTINTVNIADVCEQYIIVRQYRYIGLLLLTIGHHTKLGQPLPGRDLRGSCFEAVVSSLSFPLSFSQFVSFTRPNVA